MRQGELGFLQSWFGPPPETPAEYSASWSQRLIYAYVGGRVFLDRPLLGTGWEGELPPADFAEYVPDARSAVPRRAAALLPPHRPRLHPAADLRPGALPARPRRRCLFGALAVLAVGRGAPRPAPAKRRGRRLHPGRMAGATAGAHCGRRALRRLAGDRRSSGSRSASSRRNPTEPTRHERQAALDRARDRPPERRRRGAPRAPARPRAGAAGSPGARRRRNARGGRGVDGVRRGRARGRRAQAARAPAPALRPRGHVGDPPAARADQGAAAGRAPHAYGEGGSHRTPRGARRGAGATARGRPHVSRTRPQRLLQPPLGAGLPPDRRAARARDGSARRRQRRGPRRPRRLRRRPRRALHRRPVRVRPARMGPCRRGRTRSRPRASSGSRTTRSRSGGRGG